MTDIAMCLGDRCNAKDECHRYTAKPDGLWQSWLSTVPSKDGKACDYFIDNTHKRKWRETND